MQFVTLALRSATLLTRRLRLYDITRTASSAAESPYSIELDASSDSEDSEFPRLRRRWSATDVATTELLPNMQSYSLTQKRAVVLLEESVAASKSVDIGT